MSQETTPLCTLLHCMLHFLPTIPASVKSDCMQRGRKRALQVLFKCLVPGHKFHPLVQRESAQKYSAGICRRPAQGSVHCLDIKTGWAKI